MKSSPTLKEVETARGEAVLPFVFQGQGLSGLGYDKRAAADGKGVLGRSAERERREEHDEFRFNEYGEEMAEKRIGLSRNREFGNKEESRTYDYLNQE